MLQAGTERSHHTELTLGPITVTEEHMRKYSQVLAEPGYEANIHTDHNVAIAAGLPCVIMEGRMSVSLISAMMAREYGEAWLKSGGLDVRFIRMVKAGDTITARAVPAAADAGRDSPGTVHFDVWCETPDGDKTAVGKAWLAIN